MFSSKLSRDSLVVNTTKNEDSRLLPFPLWFKKTLCSLDLWAEELFSIYVFLDIGHARVVFPRDVLFISRSLVTTDSFLKLCQQPKKGPPKRNIKILLMMTWRVEKFFNLLGKVVRYTRGAGFLVDRLWWIILQDSSLLERALVPG